MHPKIPEIIPQSKLGRAAAPWRGIATLRGTSVLVAVFTLTIVLVTVPSASAGGSREATTGESPAETTEQTAEPQSDTVSTSDPGAVRDALRQAGLRSLDEPVPSEDFELASLNGEKRSLSSFQGQIVVLNFWASWCGPCVEEMPGMQALYDDMQGQDVTVVAVNVQEQPKVVEEFVTSNEFSFPVLLDRDGSVASRYGVRGLPTSYIVTPDGEIVASKVGFHEWDTEVVREALQHVSERL